MRTQHEGEVMKIGEEGTEQFTVTTNVNGEMIGNQLIHDPFVRTSVTLRGWKHAWRALTSGIKVNVCVDGTHGAVSAVMMLDPEKLQYSTDEHLKFCARSREENEALGLVGYCSIAQ